jgi:hypothetical protein
MDRTFTTKQSERKQAATKEALKERVQVEKIDTVRYEVTWLEEVKLYFSLGFL